MRYFAAGVLLIFVLIAASGCGRDAEFKEPAGIQGYMETASYTAEGAKITQYIGTGTSREAVEDFSRWAEDDGWVAVNGRVEALGAYTGVGFKKGGDLLVVHASGEGGQVAVITIVVPDYEEQDYTADEVERAPVPSEIIEAEGEDPEGIPVYPGAVRSGSFAAEQRGQKYTSADYVSESGIDEITAYYEGWLEEEGWETLLKTRRNGQVQIMAEKGDSALSLTFRESAGHPGHTDISIQKVH